MPTAGVRWKGVVTWGLEAAGGLPSHIWSCPSPFSLPLDVTMVQEGLNQESGEQCSLCPLSVSWHRWISGGFSL